MKSYGAPRYTQYEYDYASSVYDRYCLANRDPHESAPIRPARLPLMRPQYGRWFAGVCKGISMHLGVSVGLIRLIAIASTFAFGSGVIAYVFLWATPCSGHTGWPNSSQSAGHPSPMATRHTQAPRGIRRAR